ILDHAGMAPGFLIGGVPANFGLSARRGGSDFFVVEADEYDTAFFDKRSKFVHYRPEIAVLGNLEFDHADIFDDLAAIERQFHHLVRTVPGKGRLLVADNEPALDRVLAMGAWTPIFRFGSATESPWRYELEREDASRFQVIHQEDIHQEGIHQEGQGAARIDEDAVVDWPLTGAYNARNALAALAAAHACGVDLARGAAALSRFETPRRRQELRGEVAGIQVIDDFAHHPTAIAATLEGLRAATARGRLLAVIEPRSNTMRLGTLRGRLAECVAAADAAFWYQPAGLDWSLSPLLEASPVPARLEGDLDALVAALVEEARPYDRIVVMSNGGFGGIHDKLIAALEVAHG
ncbi:MAG: UDP-N-acetylmuramate:L-alanyl-gamma-D-glutamyl-meso-diaminopimelate ligase, partial [Halomonas sp.]